MNDVCFTNSLSGILVGNSKPKLAENSNRRRSSHTRRHATNAINFIIVLIVLASTAPQAAAQFEVCSCSPPIYNWKLDFSKGCPVNLPDNGGTKTSPLDCYYADIDDGHNGDFAPVQLTDLLFFDLNLNLEGIKNLKLENTELFNGNEITFASATASGDTRTGGIQATFRAINASGQAFTLEVIVRFSNLCETLPFEVGSSLGYLVFVSCVVLTSLYFFMFLSYNEQFLTWSSLSKSLTCKYFTTAIQTEIAQPRAETCNIASQRPSDAPSQNPTVSPSSSPTQTLTGSPSFKPSRKPSPSPTAIPTALPSKGPSPSPSKGPSPSPVDVPTSVPTITPTVVPTESPVPSVSNSPSLDPTQEPTQEPTLSPNDSPTKSPTKSLSAGCDEGNYLRHKAHKSKSSKGHKGGKGGSTKSPDDRPSTKSPKSKSSKSSKSSKGHKSKKCKKGKAAHVVEPRHGLGLSINDMMIRDSTP